MLYAICCILALSFRARSHLKSALSRKHSIIMLIVIINRIIIVVISTLHDVRRLSETSSEVQSVRDAKSDFVASQI